MAFCDLAVDCLFDPGHFVHELIAMLVEHVQGKAVLGIDDPDEQEALGLDLFERQVQDVFVSEGAVSDGNTSSRVG